MWGPLEVYPRRNGRPRLKRSGTKNRTIPGVTGRGDTTVTSHPVSPSTLTHRVGTRRSRGRKRPVPRRQGVCTYRVVYSIPLDGCTLPGQKRWDWTHWSYPRLCGYGGRSKPVRGPSTPQRTSRVGTEVSQTPLPPEQETAPNQRRYTVRDTLTLVRGLHTGVRTNLFVDSDDKEVMSCNGGQVEDRQ